MEAIKKGRSEVLRLQERLLFFYIILSFFSFLQINAQVCSGTTRYVKNEASISSGATANSATTQTACEAACTVDSTCLSYQIDSNVGSVSICWLQRSTLSLTRPAPNVVEYVKNCDTGCPSGQISYISNSTSVSSGATANPATTETACEAACTADSACLSYQLDVNLGTQSYCWLQRSSLSVVRPVSGITERIKYCNTGCPSGQISYNSNSTSVSSGATANPATTEAACQAACTADNACLSYQLDVTSGTQSYCWLQKSSLGVGRPVAGIIEKIKYCSTGCATKYTTNATLISNGPTANPVATTEAQCEAACTADSACLSYQLDSNPGTTSFCWFQKSTLSNARVAPNIIERIKYLDCVTNCVTKYAMNASSFSTGAVANAALTQQACEAACSADNACVSYQLDTSPTTSSYCWLQRSTLSSLRPATGIVEYVKYQDCGSTSTLPSFVQPSSSTAVQPITTTITTISVVSSTTNTGVSSISTICPTVFESNSTLVSIGATSNSQADTFESCRSACLSSASCLSFQINVIPGQPYCWLQSKPNAFLPGTLGSDPLIVEYIKIINRCSTSTATTNSQFATPFITITQSLATQIVFYTTKILIPELNWCEKLPCGEVNKCTPLFNSYKCECFEGYKSNGIQNCIDINECVSSPCQNGGICLNQINQFNCICPSALYGVFCQNVKTKKKKVPTATLR